MLCECFFFFLLLPPSLVYDGNYLVVFFLYLSKSLPPINAPLASLTQDREDIFKHFSIGRDDGLHHTVLGTASRTRFHLAKINEHILLVFYLFINLPLMMGYARVRVMLRSLNSFLYPCRSFLPMCHAKKETTISGRGAPKIYMFRKKEKG